MYPKIKVRKMRREKERRRYKQAAAPNQIERRTRKDGCSLTVMSEELDGAPGGI
jgi:hypothetical protein